MKQTITVDSPGVVDGLERSRFTDYLLRVIGQVDAVNGAVIGLEGEWGSGKTWVLRQLQAKAEGLASTSRPIFLQFNPWMVSGAHDLVAAMLGQLSRQLAELGRKSAVGVGKKALTKAVKAIDKYAGSLTAVKHAAPALNWVLPGAGVVAGSVAAAAEAVSEVSRKIAPVLSEAATKKSLPELRDQICQALEAFGRKIVVIVDDLDRITPAEVASMLQAIKAVADFPNVVYLLAYELETLAHAVEKALKVKDGRAYLEKIVQLPVRLPELPARRIQEFAKRQIGRALDTYELHQSEDEDLSIAAPIAAALMTTARDAMRLHTTLCVRAKPLRGEVNLADLVVAEAIAMKIPQFVPWLAREKWVILHRGLAMYDSAQAARAMHSVDGDFFGMGTNQRHPEKEKLLAELRSLGSLTGASRAVYKTALEFLFDRVQGSAVRSNKRSNHLRLQRFRHYYQWRCLCDSQEAVSVAQITAWLRDPKALIATEWIASPEGFNSLAALVHDLMVDTEFEVNATAWVDLFVQLEKLLGTDLLVAQGMGYGPEPMLAGILRRETVGKRSLAMKTLVQTASVPLASSVMVEARRDLDSPARPLHYAGAESLVTESTEMEELLRTLLTRAETWLLSGAWAGVHDAPSPYTCLCWMGLAGVEKNHLAELARMFHQSPTG